MREPRLRALIVVALVIAAPAAVLQWRCGGEGCQSPPAASTVPFCGLDASLRRLVEAGYREGRSPDVLAVAAGPPDVATGSLAWPSVAAHATEVPIALLGPGVGSATVPRGAGLDRIAPSMALAAGIDRPFPEVRSGAAFDAVSREDAPLVVIVAWVGIGTSDLEAHPSRWPRFASLLGSGAGNLAGSTGSLPVDPAATLTTIGTGGLPSEHGITGTIVRGTDGVPTAAFGPRAPLPVIATLAEDADESAAQASRIALVAGAPEDRGLVGGQWYVGADEDDVMIGRSPVPTVRRLVGAGYGGDAPPDVIAVALRGPLARLDAETGEIVDTVRARVPGAIFAVAGTGSRASAAATPAADVVTDLTGTLEATRPIVAAIGAEGVFLRATAAAAGGISSDRVADELRAQTTALGSPRFADAFPGYAVELARYC